MQPKILCTLTIIFIASAIGLLTYLVTKKSYERFGPLETATDAVCQDQKNKRECVASNKAQIITACNSVLADMVCSELPSDKSDAIAACRADPAGFTCKTLGEDSFFCQDIKSICSADNIIM
jgi:hypothetical protein